MTCTTINRLTLMAMLIATTVSTNGHADVLGVVEGVNVPSDHITADAAGKISVTINEADSGVSYNSYSAFNVPVPGLDLDNTDAAAAMIINEVVQGGDISSMNGQLAVIGDKAHVIVANPNGILVDGGSFFNTANVMLTAAQIHQFQAISGEGILSGEAESNPFYVVHARDGSVVIGPGGISGDFPRLDLIAKTVALTGESDLDGLMNIVGGDSTQVLYRGSDLPEMNESTSESLARYEFAGSCAGSLDGDASWDCNELTPGSLDESDAAYVVDISGVGTALRAGKISVTVNDLGPGFRFAGDSLVAFADGISIRSDGTIEISAENGGDIRAAGPVEFDNSSSEAQISFEGDESLQATVTSGTDLIINAGAGDVLNLGYSLESVEISPESATSSGSVQIISNNLINRSLSENALGIVFSSSNKVSSGGFDWGTEDRNTAGLSITSTGDIYNDTGRFVSNNGIAFNIGGDFYNRVTRISGSNIAEVNSVRKDSGWFIFKKNSVQSNYDYGALGLNGMLAHVEASAGDIQFNFVNNGKLYNIGGEITANGAQNFVAFDDFGSTLNGAESSMENQEDSDSTPAMKSLTLRSADQAISYSYQPDGSMTNRNILQAFIEYVQAARKADPSLFSDLSSLELIAGTADSESDSTAIVLGSEIADTYALSAGNSWLTPSMLKADGSIYIGVPVVADVIDGDSDSVDDELELETEYSDQVRGLASTVFNQAVITGEAIFNSSCGWLCSQSAESNVVSNGGLISAQNTIEVALQSGSAIEWSSVVTDLSVLGSRASEYGATALEFQPTNGLIANVGGRITALNGGGDLYSATPQNLKNAISIRSADGGDGIHVLAKSLSTIDAINRDQGLLGGRYAKLIKQDQGGSFIANQGQIDFSGLLSPVAVKRWGGQFQAANGVTINDSDDLNNGGTLSEDEVDPDGLGPSKDSPLSSSSLGLTGSLIESIF